MGMGSIEEDLLQAEPLLPWNLDNSANELRIREFYASGEPETTTKYPLSDYMGSVCLKGCAGELGIGMFLEGEAGSEALAGEILLVDNAEVTCACDRRCSSYTPRVYTHSPEHFYLPPNPRVPPHVHQHLAHKFARKIENFPLSVQAYESLISQLDACRLTTDEIPPRSPVDPRLRGPWKSRKREPGWSNVDVEKVWSIVANNAVCDKMRSKNQDEPIEVETCESWGLWRMASFINHSCDPNCHRIRIGNAVIIRAAHDIAAGVELTLPYFDIFEPLVFREVAAARWGFWCECTRCIFERSIGRPYDSIQDSILDLKRQLHNAWSIMDRKLGKSVVERILEKLSNHVEHTQALMYVIDQLVRSSDMATELRKASDWVSASFIEPMIAQYALCEMRSPCLGEPYEEEKETRTQEARYVLRTARSMMNVLEVAVVVNPGNLLSQEFYSMMVDAFRGLSFWDFDENSRTNRKLQRICSRAGRSSYSAYYGHPAEETLDALMKPEF